jgi:hyperosmotically inducible protein
MMLVSNRFFTIVVCALVLVLTNCQQEGSVEKAGKEVDQAVEKAGEQMDKARVAIGAKVESATASLDDAAITAKIKAETLSDSLLKASQIEVATTGGVVKLTGNVGSQKSYDRAQEIASGVKDVKAVENSLAIKSY